ncbi:MAG: SOS response-associated peptidase [Acidobacteriota bacterium]
MCGRFTLKRPRQVKIQRLDDDEIFPSVPRYNIAPGQDVLAVRQTGEERFVSNLVWGLVPSWSEQPAGFINARAETLETKPSFREAFDERRCLIPADGFYEWQKLRNDRQPYYFQMKDEAPFWFAGIWDKWQNGAVSINSCAIITTTPNALLASIHDRMPVILSSPDAETWLKEEAKPEELKGLLVPFSADEMKSHAVSRDVNHVKNDTEHLVLPIDPTINTNLSLFALEY